MQAQRQDNAVTVPDPGLPSSMPERLDRLALRGQRDAPALIVNAEALDHAALDTAVAAAAAWLAARAAPGDRIASWLPKTVLACILPLACARAGLVHVPINPLLRRGQVAHILADCGARLLVSQPSRFDALDREDVPGGCEQAIDSEIPLAGDGLPPSDGSTDDLAAILYTSGSTGRPKGVMLSNANLWLGAVSVARYFGLAADERTLCALPLSFDAGLNQLLATWHAGGAALPLDYLVARDVIGAVERHHATALLGVPPLWVQLAEAEWPERVAAHLRRIGSTGGRMPVPLVRRLRALFPHAELHLMYGLTEAFRSTSLAPALVDAHPETVGTAIPFAEVLVVRPDGTLCGDGEPGELVHAGPLVAQGYWRGPEATQARFRPAPAASRYGGTAAWSGDSVVRDADGLLRFVGREDEMIKVSGNRVSPTDIEEAAVASGAVAEAAAFGVADDRLGQAVLLVARAEIEGAEARLTAWLKRELPSWMQPRRIVWRDTLPRNANGKIDRAALRAELVP